MPLQRLYNQNLCPFQTISFLLLCSSWHCSGVFMGRGGIRPCPLPLLCLSASIILSSHWISEQFNVSLLKASKCQLICFILSLKPSILSCKLSLHLPPLKNSRFRPVATLPQIYIHPCVTASSGQLSLIFFGNYQSTLTWKKLKRITSSMRKRRKIKSVFQHSLKKLHDEVVTVLWAMIWPVAGAWEKLSFLNK